MKGKHHTEETRIKLSEASKGKHHSWEIIYFDEVEITEQNVLNKLIREGDLKCR